MSREAEREIIFSHFKTLADPIFGENVAWPNQPFETPAREKFVIVNIVNRGSVRLSLGRTFIKRHMSTVQADIYIPQDQGTKISRQISDTLEDEYEMLELITVEGEKITFGTPSSRVLAPNEIRATNVDDNWDRYVFEAPYYRDQVVEK